MSDFRREPAELAVLLDEDVKALKSLFPKKRVKILAQVGLKPDASDSDIVEMAWNRGFTIVTANGTHFRKAIADFQERGAAACSCLFGLVVLTTDVEGQRRRLSTLTTAERQLRYAGKAYRVEGCMEAELRGARDARGGPRVVESLPACKLRGGHLRS